MSRSAPTLALALLALAAPAAAQPGSDAGGAGSPAGGPPQLDPGAGARPLPDDALGPRALPDAGALPPDALGAIDGGRGAADAGAADAGAQPAPLEPPPEGHVPSLETAVEPSEGLVTGDSFTLTIVAEVPEGDDVAVPKEQSFEPFEVLDKNVTVRPEDDGRRRFELKLEMIAFEPGEHELGPVRLRVVTADGVVGHVETDPIRLEIGSVLGNEPNAEPKPRTEPVRVMEDDYTLAWVGGGLLAIVLIAIATLLIARWWRRRPRPEPPPPPPRPAWQIAMEKLSALRSEREQAFTDGRGVEWVDRLSDALREYLGHHYGFEGLESTTDEVIGRLRKAEPRGTLLQEVSGILGECDLVKFARQTPDVDRAIRMLDDAERIVQRSMGVSHPATRPETETETSEQQPEEPEATTRGGGSPNGVTPQAEARDGSSGGRGAHREAMGGDPVRGRAGNESRDPLPERSEGTVQQQPEATTRGGGSPNGATPEAEARDGSSGGRGAHREAMGGDPVRGRAGNESRDPLPERSEGTVQQQPQATASSQPEPDSESEPDPDTDTDDTRQPEGGSS